MRKNIVLIVLFFLLIPRGFVTADDFNTVNMANGIKIGEVTSNSAIIWTRLTKYRERNIKGKPFPKNVNKERRSFTFSNLEEMEGAVPGIGGEVRVLYWPKRNEKQKQMTEWQKVEPDKDFTKQIQLKSLFPETEYLIIVEGRKSGNELIGCKVYGKFRTSPKANSIANISFAVVTGQDYPRRDDLNNGHKIYPIMSDMDPDFFVHTGDAEYYDKPGPYADNLKLARFKWNRIYAMPYQREFHNETACYFIKDDHDTLKNDCWPGQKYGDLTWEQGLAVFREQVPMGEKTYRTFRWGKDLQIWLVEGRDFRSPNEIADGPDKTIWGEAQKKWFFNTVAESDATFRILISPTPIVGPDRKNKNDNHANTGFSHEGDELRRFIGSQKNMYIICGDRHWQYVSVDKSTGAIEYSCGPTSDTHASGFNEKDKSEMHRYLKIRGGFLFVEINRKTGTPQISFSHYGVNGENYNKDTIVIEK